MLNTSLGMIKGVGPKKQIKLERLGLHVFEDAVYNWPRSYVDKRDVKYFSQAEEGMGAVFEATVVSVGGTPSYGKRKGLLKIGLTDGMAKGEAVFFNAAWLKGRFQAGQTYLFYGQPKRQGAKVTLFHPEFIAHDDPKIDQFLRIEPVYNLTEGIGQKDMIKLHGSVIPLALPYVEENLPEDMLDHFDLPAKGWAVQQMHTPTSVEDLQKARRRFVFEELFSLQVGLLFLKKSFGDQKGKVYQAKNQALDQFLATLPFSMTPAQEKVWLDIQKDMYSDKNMNRLIQGDVGSGKTLIAMLSMYLAVLNGKQAVLMAPTEILAEQHFESYQKQFAPLGVTVDMLTGSVKDRKSVLGRLESGESQMVIGTHALLEDHVAFQDLGMVITDEQHRFGVRQRNKLSAKGMVPEMLIMSATPIPRTLSLILYGDVDVSVIDQLPVGRIPIKTRFIKPNKYDDMYEYIRKQVGEGRQAYVVCPLVEDSEVLDLQSATSIYERMSTTIYPDLKVGLVHGKMKAKEKDAVMRSFASGETDILVSTTVIEVGINVPNASIMVIQDCERFGLSQLHQLRGRVGRGQYQSWCFLVSGKLGKIAQERVKTMVETTDGFKIADKDLELRGPGELLGTRQHGVPELRLANLSKDGDLLRQTQAAAVALVDKFTQEGDSETRVLIQRITKPLFKEFSI